VCSFLRRCENSIFNANTRTKKNINNKNRYVIVPYKSDEHSFEGIAKKGNCENFGHCLYFILRI
jgi:hypothetical protein